ncbi:MAG: hypothetical protein IJO29_09085 [Oscillospiraceae bacterium]|nr:hypothetical protein [Oscillospiraceae bacterium]
MTNIIEELFYGNLEPQARSVKNNSIIEKELATLAENEQLLLKSLSGEEKRLFINYVNAWGVVLGTSDLDRFTVGFRLGARFAYDAFVSEEAPFAEI